MAEEVVQTTLCRAVCKLATYRGEATLLTWLCTICRHEIRDWFRQRRRNQYDLLGKLQWTLGDTGVVSASRVRAERVVVRKLPTHP